MDWTIREDLLWQASEKTRWASLLSRKTIWKVRDVLRGLGSLGDALLLGSWARYLVTSNKLIVRHDVDLMISRPLSKRFYELALALRREGFHPIIRIPDSELDKVLSRAGLSQEPIRTTKRGSNYQWGLYPMIRNGRLRRYLGVNLELTFWPSSFEVVPGHWTWVVDGDHDPIVRSIGRYAGTEFLLDYTKQTKTGLLVPSLDAQLRFNHILLNRFQAEGHRWASKKIARTIAQLEEARVQRRLPRSKRAER
jgi:hypothetical protein